MQKSLAGRQSSRGWQNREKGTTAMKSIHYRKNIRKGVKVTYSPDQRVTLRKGGLGYIVKGQTGQWYGTPPPSRQKDDISRFSSASRRRLREILATARPIEDGCSPYGLCLTIPGDIRTPDEVRELWRDWIDHHFIRYFKMPMIWRIELQTRRQAHWHIVVWSKDFVRVFELAEDWKRTVRSKFGPFKEATEYGFEEYGVKVQPLGSASESGVIGYLADHTSKHKQSQLGWVGRQWGVVNRRLLRFDTQEVLEVTPEQHQKAVRQFRRLQERLRKRDGAYTGASVTPSANVSRSIFGRDAERLIKCYENASR